MKTHSLLLGSLLLGLAPALASAATYYVKPAAEGGSDSNNGTSWDTALATPAAGIAKVNNNGKGHHVMFAPGTYQLTDAIGCTGGYSENKRVVISGSTDNPEDVVLRGTGDREIFRFAANVTLANLTIENGSNSGRSNKAAGVRIGSQAVAGSTVSIVTNCIIRNCQNAYGNGNYGGPVVVYSDGLLVDCVVSNNTAVWRGSGVMLAGPDAKAVRCLVTGNDATSLDTSGAAVIGVNGALSGWGGGQLEDCTISNNIGSVYAGVLNVPTVSNCLFEGNVASLSVESRGGGLFVNTSVGTAIVSRCVFRDNTASIGGGLNVQNVTANITDCLFENNTAGWCGGGACAEYVAKAAFDNCQFLGNTTVNGNASQSAVEWGGGGLFLKGQSGSAWCSVSNCVFGSNSTNCRGGGFSHTWQAICQAAIANCVFTNNTSVRQGGGIVVREDNNTHSENVTIIRNCLVANNRTTLSTGDSNGGGIHFVTRNPVSIENCTIVSNVTAYANSGGVHHRYGGQLVNCIIAFNKKDGGRNDEVASGTVWTCAEGTYLNCCSYPNITSHLTAENGCINADPLFTDAANGDFTLGNNSPCANKGRLLDWMTKDTFDLSGLVPRVSDSYPDIGCYERPIPHFILLFR